MERVIEGENVRICAVCNKKIDEEKVIATKIDGLWIGSEKCHKKYLHNENIYPSEGKCKLGKKQALYDEQKRAQTSATINCPQY